MHRFFFFSGAILAGLAVIMGAATGHETSSLSELAHIWIDKAIRYQFNHSLALLIVAIALTLFPMQGRLLNIAGFCFIAGIVFFSGSLYIMAFTGISAGYFTPLGGIGFLAGWLAVAFTGLKLTPHRL